MYYNESNGSNASTAVYGSIPSTLTSTFGVYPTAMNTMDSQSCIAIIRQMSPHEINAQFDAFLKQLDLPPDKIRTLRDYDTEKKRKLLLDERQRESVVEPSVYLEKLALYLDKKTIKKKKKLLGKSPQTSTELLKHMEISLRTNSIDWVRSFLSDENHGLSILVEYLSGLQESFSSQLYESATSSTSNIQQQMAGVAAFAGSDSNIANGAGSVVSGSVPEDPRSSSRSKPSGLPHQSSSTTSKPSVLKQHSSCSKYIGDVEDDMHVGVSCLRALMNNKFGLKEVMEYPSGEAIYCIVRTILHHSLRTKSLAIDLLSAICIIQDGHELILRAFNRFQMEFKERSRFETLFNFFRYPAEFQIDFMTACMKFINVLVHSTEDGNQRVALQHEFSCIGLDRYLEEELVYEESELLLTHVNSYRSNRINVDQLIADANHRMELLEQVAFLEGMNSAHREKLQEVEADYIARRALLDRRLADLLSEREDLMRERDKRDFAISTMTRDFKDREQNYQHERSRLESRIQELEQAKKELQMGLKVVQKPSTPVAKTPPTPTGTTSAPSASVSGQAPKSSQAPAPPPPAPPPPPSLSAPKAPLLKGGTVGPPPPPPPSNLLKSGAAAGGAPPPPPPNIKQLLNPSLNLNGKPEVSKKIAMTKAKLPIVNWAALSAQQVKGTVFNDINDEKLADVLDLSYLEDMFKTGAAHSPDGGGADAMASSSSSATGQLSPGSSASSTANGPTSGAGKISLLDIKRLQNIAITRRKLAKSPQEIMSAVHRFDFTALPQDHVDILLPLVPTAEEIKQYKGYAEKNHDSFESLTAEDQFLAALINIERLQQKLSIMSFMAGFDESVGLIMPQLRKVTAASESIRKADKFHRVIEVILAMGNAMNGTRRTPVYGFKLSSFDTLSILKSPKDRNITLMHAVAHQVQDKFPELMGFVEQLKFAEAASAVSIETVGVDIRELSAKYEQACAERDRKGKDVETPLSQFTEKAAPQIESLKESWKLAQAAFLQCAEYYGEPVKTAQPDAFFSRISSFVKNFEQALADNEARAATERRQKAEQERRAVQRSNRAGGPAHANDRMLDELNAKFLQSMRGSGAGGGGKGKGGTRKIDPSDLEHGDFEKIMNGLNDGYMASDSAGVPPVPLKRRVRGGADTKSSPSPNRRSRAEQQLQQRERVT